MIGLYKKFNVSTFSDIISHRTPISVWILVSQKAHSSIVNCIFCAWSITDRGHSTGKLFSWSVFCHFENIHFSYIKNLSVSVSTDCFQRDWDPRITMHKTEIQTKISRPETGLETRPGLKTSITDCLQSFYINVDSKHGYLWRNLVTWMHASQLTMASNQ